MLNFGNKEFRNIVQQVAKNKADIADILTASRVLGEFGIKVVGHLDSEADLPLAENYTGDYGDAYAVGDETPYSFWIFTRPSEDNPEAHWFYIGEFPLPGPEGKQGIQGIQGLRGETGSGLIAEDYAPSTIEGYEIGQIWVHVGTGDVYKLFSGAPNWWGKVSNWLGPRGLVGPTGKTGATGPAGPAGKTGEQGPMGQGIAIRGQVATTSSLPDAREMALGDGFLVGSSAPFHLYVIVIDNGVQKWLDTGVFNNFSYVALDIPVNAEAGQLSPEQLTQLLSSPYNALNVNNEYYRLNDNNTSANIMVYSHVGDIDIDGISTIKNLLLDTTTGTFDIVSRDVAPMPARISGTASAAQQTTLADAYYPFQITTTVATTYTEDIFVDFNKDVVLFTTKPESGAALHSLVFDQGTYTVQIKLINPLPEGTNMNFYICSIGGGF